MRRLYYYTRIYTKSKRILLFFPFFCKDFFKRSMMFFPCEQAQNILPVRRPSDDFNNKHPYTRPYQVCVYRQKLITKEEKHRLRDTKHGHAYKRAKRTPFAKKNEKQNP